MTEIFIRELSLPLMRLMIHMLHLILMPVNKLLQKKLLKTCLLLLLNLVNNFGSLLQGTLILTSLLSKTISMLVSLLILRVMGSKLIKGLTLWTKTYMAMWTIA
jgi:hypothetical protein